MAGSTAVFSRAEEASSIIRSSARMSGTEIGVGPAARKYSPRGPRLALDRATGGDVPIAFENRKDDNCSESIGRDASA
jgi:hypothetical protein